MKSAVAQGGCQESQKKLFCWGGRRAFCSKKMARKKVVPPIDFVLLRSWILYCVGTNLEEELAGPFLSQDLLPAAVLYNWF